jgi:hypothetical protein
VKTLSIILLLTYGCYSGKKEPIAAASVPIPAGVPVVIEFEADIQPILQSHCSPCHFKGGKMYEPMPFDKSKTLVDFQQGILRRLKNEQELEKIKEYLAQMK